MIVVFCGVDVLLLGLRIAPVYGVVHRVLNDVLLEELPPELQVAQGLLWDGVVKITLAGVCVFACLTLGRGTFSDVTPSLSKSARSDSA